MRFPNSQAPGTPGSPPPPPDPQNERMWAALSHLAGLAAYVGIPFGHIVGPLIVWLLKKDELPFVDDQGKEALNFQISVTIYIALCVPPAFVLVGIPLIILLALFQLIATIIGGVKAGTGVRFRYPLCIRFLR